MTTTGFNLFDLSYRVARELGIVIEGTATAGATTSITDTVGLLDVYEDNWWNGGTAWILYDAAPVMGLYIESEYARISDFVKATGVVTITPALTQAVAAGDRYGLATKEYPRDIIISHINQVLGEIPISTISDALTTDENTTEYDLPADMLDQDIEVFMNTHDTTDDNYWIQMYDWEIQESATGTEKVLIFHTQPENPYHIRIKYHKPHPPLYTSTDKLRESIDINRVVLDAAYRLLLWKKAQKNVVDPYLDARLGELYPRVQAMKMRSPRKDYIKLNTYGFTDNFGGS